MRPPVLMLCPSRGRPAKVAELRQAWAETTGPGEADLLVAVDNDDPYLEAYQAGGPVEVIPPLGWLGPILNMLALEHVSQYPVIGFLGDDHRPRTPGWARKLARAIPASGGVAYGNDVNQGAAAATAVLISSSLIAALTYMVPPGIRHLCMDLFWLDLGRETNLTYFPGVILEHMHPTLGKADWDEGYLKCNAEDQFRYDWHAYRTFLENQWPGDLARLREALAVTR